MKADEIKDFIQSGKLQDDIFWLAEIAAQLAKINENLSNIHQVLRDDPKEGR